MSALLKSIPNVTFRVTKTGVLVKQTHEHYLRSDVVCGFEGCKACEAKVQQLQRRRRKRGADADDDDGDGDEATAAAAQRARLSRAAPLLVIDTNVALHQIDFLEHAAVRNVVVPQTVLDELAHRNAYTLARLRDVIADASRRFFVFYNELHPDTFVTRGTAKESDNDRNDRAIRVVARWYARHGAGGGGGDGGDGGGGGLSVLLLTNDRALLACAKAESITAQTVHEYARERAQSQPDLLDVVVAEASDEEEDASKRKRRRRSKSGSTDAAAADDADADDGALYDAHWTADAMAAGERAGRLLRGTLHVSAHNYLEARVAVRGSASVPALRVLMDTPAEAAGGVLVLGAAAMNRAVDGDLIVVELLPRAAWRAPSDALLDADDVGDATAAATAGTAADDDDDAADAAGKRRRAASDAASSDAALMASEAAALTAATASARASTAATASSAATTTTTTTATVTSAAARAQPTGRVVGIVRRNWRAAVGVVLPPPATLMTSESVWALFQPRDRRLPRVRLRTRQWRALAGRLVQAAVDGWSRYSRYPIGHFVRVIGDGASPEAMTDALLVQYDIPSHAFGDAVLACLPAAPWRVTPADEAAREDMRCDERCVLSVDPPGCTDIDDVLHARLLSGGGGGGGGGGGEASVYEVGVHIADVTHFVRPGTAIDREAAARGTTVYLVDRRIDMLPAALSGDICSLMPRVDRLAFSVLWRVRVGASDADDVEVLETRFAKTIIKSRAALTYARAQTLIDNDTSTAAAAAAAADAARGLGADVECVRGSLRALLRIARRLRAARLRRGALTLANADVRIVRRADESATPTDIELYAMHATNYMVEEFMLLANIAVAERTHAAFPAAAMLRRHPVPDAHAFDALVAAAAHVNVRIDPSSSLTLARSLDAVEARVQAKAAAKAATTKAAADAAAAAAAGADADATTDDEAFLPYLLRILATRCMTQALNFSSGTLARDEYYHYGLAVPLYTHFTSPIRRYTDVVVHRLLAAAIGFAPLDAAAAGASRDAVQRTANAINRRQRAAQLAARDSTALYTLVYFANRRTTEDAYVLRVRANGFVCLVPRYGVEGVVYLVPRGHANTYVYDEKQQSLTSASGRVFRVFQRVRVTIYVETKHVCDKKLMFELAE